MNVAVIFLDERPYKGENPQIIFETLNSLGKPLSLSDLVRNFVLLPMDSKDQSDIYEEVWYPKVEEIFDDDSSKFFRDYLQYKTSSSLKVVSDNNTKELYQQFKKFVDQNFEKHSDFIEDIVRYVKWYQWIITEIINSKISTDKNNNEEIKELLRNIFHDIKTEAFKPFVLGLLEYHQAGINGNRLSDDLFIITLQSIRTYLIRRRILGLTGAENTNIPILSKKISEIANRKISMFDLLTNMIYALRLPNDIELNSELKTMNFYKDRDKYSKFILGKIEEKNAKIAVDFRSEKVTIEHIMPQKIESSWKVELGNNFEEIHNEYLHNIGNLILTEFNGEMGNKSFKEKKKKLQDSSLNYRLDVIDRDIWNKESILEHQDNMISWLLETFPLPEKLKQSSNWNTLLVDEPI